MNTMTSTDEWHSAIASTCRLPADAARQLHDFGFVVLPGPEIPGGNHAVCAAYDRAVATADPANVYTGRTGSSTRVDNFLNYGVEFGGLCVYPPLLAACCQVIGGPFKLSGMRARTLHAGAEGERLHVDVKQRAAGWPLLGCIWMIDAFDAQNGATRFVPASHLRAYGPDEAADSRVDHDRQVLACGPAGSIIIFNASVWHGHGANRSATARRSIQAHFVPRDVQSTPNPAERMRPETLQRVGDLARYVIGVAAAQAGGSRDNIGSSDNNQGVRRKPLTR